MRDKNGTEVKIGDRVVDVHGNVGEMCNITGVPAIRFDHDGQEKYAFPHKIVESEIEIVEVK